MTTATTVATTIATAAATAVRPSGPLAQHRFTVTRSDAVAYGAASGDLNPVHWSDRVALRAGLPGVVAHGMLTMGLAARAVADWTGPDWTVLDYRVSFARPLVLPDDDAGVVLTVDGEVVAPEAADRLKIVLSVASGAVKLLARTAVVLGPRRAPEGGTP